MPGVGLTPTSPPYEGGLFALSYPGLNGGLERTRYPYLLHLGSRVQLSLPVLVWSQEEFLHPITTLYGGVLDFHYLALNWRAT